MFLAFRLSKKIIRHTVSEPQACFFEHENTLKILFSQLLKLLMQYFPIPVCNSNK